MLIFLENPDLRRKTFIHKTKLEHGVVPNDPFLVTVTLLRKMLKK